MEALKLANTKKEWFYIFLLLLTIFSINLYRQYTLFERFTSDEIFEANGKIVNIYPKEKNNIIKIETDEFNFFTTINKELHLERFQSLSFIVVTEKINFIDYLRGFYAPTFSIEKLDSNHTIVENINQSISNQHEIKKIGDLYNTLFLATPLDKELQNLSAIYGIAHVISISGFHLGIISFVSFWFLNFIYSPFHQKYFPYRNKKLDILIVISIVLFIYLIALNIIPSFLRSFVMFIAGILLLRTNIKILSFGSLAIVVAFIIAFFPRFLFSIGLWFSAAGVFYIFLFIKYFNNLNKYLAFILFNFWIFFAMNPITHFFFGTTSLVQLLSPFITIGFIAFYPLALLIHFFQFGDLMDVFLFWWINTNPNSYNLFSPFWFFLTHIIISLLSIKYRIAFYFLNISLFIFGVFLYISI